MASNGDITAHSSNFRWLFRKSHSADKVSEPENFSKSNVLPGFRHNFLAVDVASPNCVVVRNDIKRSVSAESERISSNSSRPSSMDSFSSNPSDGMSGSDYFGLAGSSASLSRSVPTIPSGPKFKLIHEGDIQVCRLNHSRTVINKILSSKFLRRWENHHLFLTKTQINSKTPSGFMEESVQYGSIEDMSVFPRWEATQKYCVCIVIPDGSLLLQANNAYVRDQWLHSISWKKNLMKYRKLLTNTRRPDVFIKELKGLIDMTLTTPLQDDCIYNLPLEIISELLQEGLSWLPKSLNEELISVISPLLELTTPTPEICDFLTKHCRENPRSRIVLEMFTPIVQRILKHNMDYADFRSLVLQALPPFLGILRKFGLKEEASIWAIYWRLQIARTVDFGKYPKTRLFVQEYIQALSCQNDGKNALEKFINSTHGVTSTCPHPRVLPNLVSICLAAIYALYEERRNRTQEDNNDVMVLNNGDWQTRLLSFVHILDFISSHEDWRPGLAQLLQPIPFPDDALADGVFSGSLKPVLANIVSDERCEVHLAVLGVRDEKDGWLRLYCPGGIACEDDGDLWSKMLHHLLECCCRRKKFLEALAKNLGPCLLRALRDDSTLQSALCSMLELEVVENKDCQMQIITTLQSTPSGKQQYTALCQRQMHLRELQQKGGPRKLTLPSRSTDADVAKLLSCGSFGNLECLSLAFTQVTSACAEQLIKIPSLRYLNLWSTQFSDAGLRLISEHLPKLQVLNLCETPVTDKGLLCLTNMKSLRKLNLNSTKLSAQTFERLKQKLPALQECDVRYTDAW